MRAEVLDKMYQILAAEDIAIIVNPLAQTASFNLKNRVLVLPSYADMDEEVADWMRAHEVAHAKWTPRVAYHENIKDIMDSLVGRRKFPNLMAAIFNILEDVRIERLMKNHLPLFERVFPSAAKKVMESVWTKMPIDSFMESKWNDLGPHDKINIVAKMNAYHDKLTQEERSVLVEALLVDEFDEIPPLAVRLYDMVLEWKINQQEQPEESVVIPPQQMARGSSDGMECPPSEFEEEEGEDDQDSGSSMSSEEGDEGEPEEGDGLEATGDEGDDGEEDHRAGVGPSDDSEEAEDKDVDEDSSMTGDTENGDESDSSDGEEGGSDSDGALSNSNGEESKKDTLSLEEECSADEDELASESREAFDHMEEKASVQSTIRLPVTLRMNDMGLELEDMAIDQLMIEL